MSAYLVASGGEVVRDMLIHLMHVLLLVLLRVGRHDVEAEMLELMPPPREWHHVDNTHGLRWAGCASVAGMTSWPRPLYFEPEPHVSFICQKCIKSFTPNASSLPVQSSV